MTMHVPVDNRVLRDARKWQRWSPSRRLLKRLSDPQAADRMERSARYVAAIVAGWIPPGAQVHRRPSLSRLLGL